MATTASGRVPLDAAAAAATAHMPNSSAAGIEIVGMSLPPPSCRRSASRAAFVAAPRRSMSAMSCGHHSATSHTLPGASAKKTYPPTPSTPLASVVL
eukprot:5239739-Pleurochrysis_carterae.AAC.1